MHHTRKDVEALEVARQEYDETKTRRAWEAFARLQRRLGLYGCPFTGNHNRNPEPASEVVTPYTDRQRPRTSGPQERSEHWAHY